MKKELNLMIIPAEFPVPLIILPETDSTNNYLTQLCNEQQSAVREFTTVIAERQTAGKGQRGNSWESEDCRNITFSFVLYPTFIEARRQFILSQIVSLSIKEELDEWTKAFPSNGRMTSTGTKEDLRHTDRKRPLRTSHWTQHFRYWCQHKPGNLSERRSQPGISKADHRTRT